MLSDLSRHYFQTNQYKTKNKSQYWLQYWKYHIHVKDDLFGCDMMSIIQLCSIFWFWCMAIYYPAHQTSQSCLLVIIQQQIQLSHSITITWFVDGSFIVTIICPLLMVFLMALATVERSFSWTGLVTSPDDVRDTYTQL